STGEVASREPRREILDAASELLLEGGAEGLTIRRLALRSGYTSPAIYQHFGDKAGLLDAILQREIEVLQERLEALPELPYLRDQLRLQFKEIVRFGREHPTNYRLMEALPPEQVLPAAKSMRDRLEAQVVGLARSKEVDSDLLQQAIWALLHGL